MELDEEDIWPLLDVDEEEEQEDTEEELEK